MSFPSAPILLAEGMNPDTALLTAIQRDTPHGYAFVRALVQADRTNPTDPVAFMHQQLPDHAEHIFRSQRTKAGGLKVDVHPSSTLGGQVMRLLGTDVARRLLEQHFECSFALANCCGGVTGPDKEKTKISTSEQIAWQTMRDC